MKMNILFMQTQFILRNSRKNNILKLRRHKWRYDEVMHLSVNKIFFPARLASIMNT